MLSLATARQDVKPILAGVVEVASGECEDVGKASGECEDVENQKMKSFFSKPGELTCQHRFFNLGWLLGT